MYQLYDKFVRQLPSYDQGIIVKLFGSSPEFCHHCAHIRICVTDHSNRTQYLLSPAKSPGRANLFVSSLGRSRPVSSCSGLLLHLFSSSSLVDLYVFPLSWEYLSIGLLSWFRLHSLSLSRCRCRSSLPSLSPLYLSLSLFLDSSPLSFSSLSYQTKNHIRTVASIPCLFSVWNSITVSTISKEEFCALRLVKKITYHPPHQSQ